MFWTIVNENNSEKKWAHKGPLRSKTAERKMKKIASNLFEFHVPKSTENRETEKRRDSNNEPSAAAGNPKNGVSFFSELVQERF